MNPSAVLAFELTEGQPLGARHHGPVDMLSVPGVDKVRTERQKASLCHHAQSFVAAFVTRCHDTTKIVFMFYPYCVQHSHFVFYSSGCVSCR